MTAKNTPCGTCCCNDCESKLPPDLRCCCACVCTSLCVTLSFGSGSGCSCDEISVEFVYDCETQSWHKTVNCEGLSVDLDFSIKTCNDTCYICLTSECLDMEYGTCPDDCQEFTPGRCFCRGEYDGISRTGGFGATWTNIDFSGCGGSYCTSGTISVECKKVIVPEKITTDCGSPLCTTCDCVCSCICVNVFGSGNYQTVDAVCYDTYTNSWHGEITSLETGYTEDWEIFLESDEYGNCLFRLETSLGTADPDTSTSCENWTWEITDGDLSYTLTATCSGCDESCDGLLAPCCSRVLPTTLTATITNQSDCVCADGAQITLVSTSTSGPGSLAIWEGEDDFGSCGHTIKITLRCAMPFLSGGDCSNFELDYEFPDECDGGGSGISPDPGCTCDPLDLDFTNTPMSADGCCNPASAASGFTISVTE